MEARKGRNKIGRVRKGRYQNGRVWKGKNENMRGYGREVIK